MIVNSTPRRRSGGVGHITIKTQTSECSRVTTPPLTPILATSTRPTRYSQSVLSAALPGSGGGSSRHLSATPQPEPPTWLIGQSPGTGAAYALISMRLSPARHASPLYPFCCDSPEG